MSLVAVEREVAAVVVVRTEQSDATEEMDE